MIPNLPTEEPAYKEALRRAQSAAGLGDALNMLYGLCDSMIFDAYEKFFTTRYSIIHQDEIHDIIGEATDEMYMRISRGDKIPRIESYLWKVIENKLLQFLHKREALERVDIANLEAKDSALPDEKIMEQREKSREYALSLAESLIPRLGLTNVQAVMKYIIDAIKNGKQDVTSTEIGEELGLTAENVRQSMKRGFERLARICKEEKLVDETHEFPFLEEVIYYTTDNEEESDEQYEEE